MWQHFIYLHRKASTNEPFYVGKGRLHKGTWDRAHAHDSRSLAWRRTVAKHGLLVEIVASCATDKVAQEIERLWISEIGRRDLGLGTLVNLTDGGDGHAGLIQSPETLHKRSINASRRRSQAWVSSIRAARKNGGNGGVVKRGDKLPQSWKDNIAATKLGADNPMFGRTGEKHPNSKRVINIATGEQYPSVTRAAAVLGLRMQTLHNMLTGFRKNHTVMRLV